MEVDAAIRIGAGHHIQLEVEVLEGLAVPLVEQVAPVALRHEGPILNGPGTLVFLRHFPALEGLAVSERREPGLKLARGEPGDRAQQCARH